MNKLNKFLFVVIILNFTVNFGFGQKTYLNTEWVSQSPQVGDGIYHSKSVTVSNQLIVTSQILNGSGDADISTIKYSANGDTLWMNTFAGTAGLDDYGINIVANLSGDVIIIGTSQNSSSGYDYTVICYDVSTGGTHWTYQWNGPTNGIDIPTDVTVDASNNVYITGGTEDTYGFSNFATLKLSDSGTFQWVSYYDYANLYDAGTSIVANGSKVYVTGASAPSIGSWEVATLEILQSSGYISNSQRSAGGATITEATSMATDASGNIYITGFATLAGNKNIQTIKLDSDLTVEWVADYIGDGEDIGNDIGVDGSGNVYITGFTERFSGKYKSVAIKYNSSGTQVWMREYGNVDTENGAIGKKIAVLPSGDIYTTGSVESTSGNHSFFFNKYDSDGNLMVARRYESESVDNQSYDICIDANDVYITGLSNTFGTLQTTVIKYSLDTRAMTPFITDSVASHVDNEIILRFDESSMKETAVNDKGKTFGPLSEFVTSSTITAMNGVYPSISWGDVKTYKIFKNLTIADSISITRTGDEMKMKPFWAMLLVEIQGCDEVILADTFQISAFPYVEAAQLNQIYVLSSDDEEYDNQHSLYSTTYPDAHINIEPAWEYETGKPFIKVGIYDSGLKYTHEDFGGSISEFGKVRDCRDYMVEGGMLSDIPLGGDPGGHGTSVAGIIGAYRNNENGIAGVAGGDWPYPTEEVIEYDPPISKGVTLYGFRMRGVSPPLTADGIAEALVEGSSNVIGSYGYAVHILNCSFHLEIDLEEAYIPRDIIHTAQEHVFRNGATLVASTSNDGLDFLKLPAYGKKPYWTIAVGGSNTEGLYHTSANYGEHIDLVAPYSTVLNYTVHNDNDEAYGSFNGTSAAAPHVAGVAALILSYLNEDDYVASNLAPDDVEFLINRYTTDITEDPADFDYDLYTGHGLLNAGQIFENIDKTEYVIRHYYINEVLTGTSAGSGNINLDDGIHVAGVYSGDYYTVQYVNSHSLNPGDLIIDSWPLNSYTNTLAGAGGYAFEEYEMELSAIGISSATCTGVLMHITEDPDGNPEDFWYPHSPSDVTKFGYTLHIKTDYAGVKENKSENTFLCYPNPANTFINLLYIKDGFEEVSFRIYDMQGNLTYEKFNVYHEQGKQILTIDVSNYAEGVYSIEMILKNETYYNKFIKL